MGNLEKWDKFARPPESALKKIFGGRLKGMTDISPQWRYKAMTEVYGPCGEGWKYTIDRLWTEQGANEQVMAFAQVSLFVKSGADWSNPIPGVGGSMLVAKESSGLHTSDEAYKMAITDALSVSMKMLGVGADIYFGLWDGSKYKDAVVEAILKADIKPCSNTGDSIEEKRQKELQKIHSSIVDLFNAEQDLDAYAKYSDVTDGVEKAYLWSLMDKGTKKNIERVGKSLKPTVAEQA